MQESSSTGRPETEHRKRIEVIWLGFHTTAWSWVGVARVTLLQEGCREEYRLKPVSCIFLDGAHVDEAKMLYRGVNVSVVSNPPVIQYTCVYMDPIQELVLTALGRVLLETIFPSMFDKSRVESFFRHFHTHSNVSELLIIRYEKSLTGVAPSLLLGFFEDQLTNVDWINNYMWGLLKSFLLMPYVNCWNSPENRLPPFF